MPFAIRDFQPADFDALWQIDQDCFPSGISYSRAELSYYIRRRASFTLLAVPAPVTDPNQQRQKKNSAPDPAANIPIAGFIVAESVRASGHIITIDVVAAARRSGVGSLLLRAAEDRLRAAHCPSVVLETAVDNIAALKFYKLHGYTVVKTHPRYYSNGVDALVLEKNIFNKNPVI